MKALLIAALFASQAAFADSIAELCPVAENVRGHENTEWSTSYAYHLTDANKDLPRVLLDDAADIAETPDPGPHRTYHNWGDEKVNVRIDYIYVSKGVRVLKYETRDDRRPGTDLYPSDHFPIIATLSLP